MMQKLNLRRMNAADLPAVAALERENFSNPWSEDMLMEELENPCSVYHVAELDGEVVGYGGMQIILDEGYVTNIAVSRQFRRMGVASALFLQFPLT